MPICPGGFLAVPWLALWLLAAALPAAEKNSSYVSAIESIRVDQLKQFVDYLADDALEGRESGRRGGLQAGSYVRDRYAALGLRGGAPGGDFLQPFGDGYRNVLAVLDGSDPKLKDQVLVIGAHYDHVGLGTRRNSRGTIGQIHNGADDNASGASALLELAEAFTLLAPPPKRSVLFIAFDAEEKGLLGSIHWARRPTVPLERIVAMINIDMIGRLRDNRLTVFGSRSGGGFRRLISLENGGPALSIDFTWTLKPQADHYAFFQHDIPILLWHTGLHDEYHTPEDDSRLIRPDGMRRVAQLIFAVAHELAQAETTPRFREAAGHETDYHQQQLFANVAAPEGRLGIGWDPVESTAEGVRVSSVAADSAAQRAGLRVGDRIIRFDGKAVRDGGGLRAAVLRAASPVALVLQRPEEGEPVGVSVELDGKPLRLGILWRVDPAEPASMVLTHVVAGSPAAMAGLQVGDRIYRVAGRDFADEREFSRLVTTLPDPLELLVEREGLLRTVVVYVESEPPERAA